MTTLPTTFARSFLTAKPSVLRRRLTVDFIAALPPASSKAQDQGRKVPSGRGHLGLQLSPGSLGPQAQQLHLDAVPGEVCQLAGGNDDFPGKGILMRRLSMAA